EERALQQAAELLRGQPSEVPEALERVLQRHRELGEELKAIRSRGLAEEARRLASAALDGAVVAGVDDLAPDQLRELALTVRQQPGVRGAGLVGSPDGTRASLVAAVAEDSGLVASGLMVDAAEAVGGADREAQAEAEALAKVVGLPVETFDDRLSTASADRSLSERGVRARARRRVVDKVAAAVLLQAWLDGGRGR